MKFLTLYEVKVNGQYTYIEAGAPTVAELAPLYTNGQTWLDSVTGFSYQLTDQVLGVWVQIEKAQDTKILLAGDSTFQKVLLFLQTFFTVSRNGRYDDPDKDYNQNFGYTFTPETLNDLLFSECVFSECTFAAAGKTITPDTDIYGSLSSFKAGDMILIGGGTRNNGYYNIDSITSTEITVIENIVDNLAQAFIFLVSIPQGLTDIVARMVWFDIFVRPGLGSGVKSERIGTYSYTLQEVTPGLSYPSDIASDLGSYESIALGGTSNYVS